MSLDVALTIASLAFAGISLTASAYAITLNRRVRTYQQRWQHAHDVMDTSVDAINDLQDEPTPAKYLALKAIVDERESRDRA